MNLQIAEFSRNSTPTIERRTKPLGHAVKVALQLYLQQLDGHEPDELYRMVVEEVERPLFECVLTYCGGNQTKAAKYLGLNRGTLRKKLKQYGLN